MKFPPTQDEIQAETPSILAYKHRTLDEVLPIIVTNRIIIEECRFDDRYYRRLSELIGKSISEYINPEVLKVLFSVNPVFAHDLQTPKSWQLVSKGDDNVRRLVRDLVEFAYDNTVHREVIRQKTIGCINVILYKLNDQDFIDQIERKTSAVKSMKLPRRSLYNPLKRPAV